MSSGGIGGIIGGTGEKLSIDIEINSSFDSTGTEEAKKEVQTLGKELGETSSKFGLTKEKAEEASNELRESISPIRSVSWDMMLMGRSISIVNTTLFGNNQIVKNVVAGMEAVAAFTRIATTAVDMYRVAILLSASASAVKTTANIAEGTSAMGVAGAYATLQAVLGNPTGLTLLAIGAATAGAITAGYLGSLPSRQTGGYIPETGPYMLHKGENVIPAGGSNFSVININMNSGPISSSLDIDNMLDAMAKRMAVESRRRGA